MGAKWLRLLGRDSHKLNLAVQELLKDPAAMISVPIVSDVSSESIVSFEVLTKDVKHLSEFLISKPIQVAFRIPCPKSCLLKSINLIDIAVLLTRNMLRL
jgi:hypothetical protein